MIISLIAAIASNGVIGRDGTTPWHLPADLRHFKQLTMGKPMLMGRKTYEAIGQPLAGRISIVVTGQRGYEAAGCIVAHSIEAGLRAAASLEEENGPAEVMIIGGAEIYRQLLPQADRLYLTCIDHPFAGDTTFPTVDKAGWSVVAEAEHAPDERNPYAYRFITLVPAEAVNRAG